MRVGKKQLLSFDWTNANQRWLAFIGDDIGLLPGEVLDARLRVTATDVVETLFCRRSSLNGSLHRLGELAGGDGWTLERVMSWVEELQHIIPRSERATLGAYSALAEVAGGWAKGYVRGAHADRCTDPSTGLATPWVLQLRLREIHDQCAAEGVAVPSAYCLIVVDAPIDDLPPFECDAAMAAIAATVTEAFHTGETIVRHGGRVMVLAANTANTHRRAIELTHVLRVSKATRWTNAIVWDDTLPDGRADVDRYVRDLVS